MLGLTLNEVHPAVDAKVSELFTNYYVQVKLGGVRFSALGEFNRPGKHVVMQNQVTIFEALPWEGFESCGQPGRDSFGSTTPNGNAITLSTCRECCQTITLFSPTMLLREPLPQRSWGVGVFGAQTLNTIVSTLSTSAALILSIISLSR